MDKDFIIEVEGVHKSFKTVHAVRGIDLRIKKGQFVAILGPNGAGKTTLVEMIEGIQKPDKGEIRILGKKWSGNEDDLHNSIGLSLQETQYIDKLTVYETLRLFASFYKLDDKRANEVVELVGLEEKRKSWVVNLSGGQRQRLALGISLLNKPKILLLDEPTTGLDPNARREIWAILFKLKKQLETSMILTTHYMEEAEQLCDYIIIIDNGQILKEGTLKQLLARENNGKIIEFTLEEPPQASMPFFEESSFNICWDYQANKGTVSMERLDSDLPVFFKFLENNDMRLKNFEFRRKTLDDLFTNLTGRHLDE
jgi:ABC-2 type transport system ATP-binding protein